MRLALIGHGKMGKAVENLARELGHEVVHVVTHAEAGRPFEGDWTDHTDVVMDFSVPEAALSNIERAVRAGLPIVEGTTGWHDELERAREIVETARGACVYASNFSLGVQIQFHLARQAARIFSRFPEYSPFLLEAHHTQKKDAPSGTALTLEGILRESYSRVAVSSLRAGYFPGTHTLGFDSLVDTLTIQHVARSRDGFARGSLFAAEWIRDKRGFYNFEEAIFEEERP